MSILDQQITPRVKLLDKHPVWVFYVLTFAVSWGVWIPLGFVYRASTRLPAWVVILATITGTAPALVSIILTGLTDGIAGIKRLFRQLLKWRFGWKWYSVVILAPAGVYLAALGIYLLLGGSTPEIIWAKAVLVLLAFVTTLPVTLAEELGWRGYALPRLLTRHNALISSVLVGVLWAGWHLVGYLIPNPLVKSDTPLFFFFINTVAFSILITWVYNNTGGSLLGSVLFHASMNTTIGFFTNAMPVASNVHFELQTILLSMVACTVIVLFGVRGFTRQHNR